MVSQHLPAITSARRKFIFFAIFYCEFKKIGGKWPFSQSVLRNNFGEQFSEAMGNQYNNAAPLGYLPDLYVQPFELRCSQHQIACIQAENLCVRFAAKLWIAFRTSLEAASGSCGILGGFFGTQKTSCNGPARNIRLNKRVTWSFDTF